MAVFNIAFSAESWLRSDFPMESFTQWVRHASPELRMGFSGLGPTPAMRPGDGDWYDALRPHMERLVGARLPLTDLARGDVWRPPLQKTIERIRAAVGDPSPPFDVYVTLGLGCRQVSQGFRDGRGIAYVWLEHFLEHRHNAAFLHLGLHALPLWTAHAIGHALRYSLPESASLLPGVLDDDPWNFWQSMDRLPLAERLLDEGLAIEFARSISGEEKVEPALGLSTVEVDWLRENGEALLKDRLARWDFGAGEPPQSQLRDLFFHDPDRFEPPWSVESPPARWGYYVGWRFFASATRGEWAARLAAPAASILDALRLQFANDSRTAA